MVNFVEKDQLELVNMMGRLDAIAEKEAIDGYVKNDIEMQEKRNEATKLGIIQETPSDFKSQYKILKSFLLAKKFEGCSVETLKGYFNVLFNFIQYIDVSLIDVKSDDIRKYLVYYQETHNVKPITVESMRRVLLSFYTWLFNEEYIVKNPVAKIKKIKVQKTIKKPFTDEELEKIKDACNCYRDLALVEFLYSSGIRVSELCALDIGDMDFSNRETVVYGKGGKERVVYFDAKTKLHLQRYINLRTDTNPALFVRRKYPFARIDKGGIEFILKELGEKAEVNDVHPHRFRRTFATNLLDKGVPIEQVQILLGHSKIDTTLIYASINQQSVKLNHSKYMRD